jgi:hypothetical protein
LNDIVTTNLIGTERGLGFVKDEKSRAGLKSELKPTFNKSAEYSIIEI